MQNVDLRLHFIHTSDISALVILPLVCVSIFSNISIPLSLWIQTAVSNPNTYDLWGLWIWIYDQYYL